MKADPQLRGCVEALGVAYARWRWLLGSSVREGGRRPLAVVLMTLVEAVVGAAAVQGRHLVEEPVLNNLNNYSGP